MSAAGVSKDLSLLSSWIGVPRGELIARSITVSFGGLKALNTVSLQTAKASITGLIGPNGSGKTTFANVITGIQDSIFRELTLDGVAIGGLRSYQRVGRGVARTFQAIRLFESLSVLDNVLLGAHGLFETGYFVSVFRTPRYRVELKRYQSQAFEVMELFGDRLLPRANEPVITLSYANRRRTEICRALMSAPRLMILDEPTAGMNPHETLELGEQLSALVTRFGFAILMIEHKMDLISRLCSRVYALDHGVGVADGHPDEIRRNQLVLEAFLGVE